MSTTSRYVLLGLCAAIAALALAVALGQLGMMIADVSAESGRQAGEAIRHAVAQPGVPLLNLIAVLALLALLRSAFRDAPKTLRLRFRRAMRGAALLLVVGAAKAAYLLTGTY